MIASRLYLSRFALSRFYLNAWDADEEAASTADDEIEFAMGTYA